MSDRHKKGHGSSSSRKSRLPGGSRRNYSSQTQQHALPTARGGPSTVESTADNASPHSWGGNSNSAVTLPQPVSWGKAMECHGPAASGADGGMLDQSAADAASNQPAHYGSLGVHYDGYDNSASLATPGASSPQAALGDSSYPIRVFDLRHHYPTEVTVANDSNQQYDDIFQMRETYFNDQAASRYTTTSDDPPPAHTSPNTGWEGNGVHNRLTGACPWVDAQDRTGAAHPENGGVLTFDAPRALSPHTDYDAVAAGDGYDYNRYDQYPSAPERGQRSFDSLEVDQGSDGGSHERYDDEVQHAARVNRDNRSHFYSANRNYAPEYDDQNQGPWNSYSTSRA